MSRNTGVGACAAAALLWGVALAPVARAQDARETRVVTVGPDIRRVASSDSGVGGGYRDLWTTPVRLPVLDSAAGGGWAEASAAGRPEPERRPGDDRR